LIEGIIYIHYTPFEQIIFLTMEIALTSYEVRAFEIPPIYFSLDKITPSNCGTTTIAVRVTETNISLNTIISPFLFSCSLIRLWVNYTIKK